MVPELRKEIYNIVAQIVVKYKPDKVILFGSAARDGSGSDSDADFSVIKKDTPLCGVDRIRELSRIVERSIPVDFFVYRPNEFEERLKMGAPFLKAILKQGEVYG